MHSHYPASENHPFEPAKNKLTNKSKINPPPIPKLLSTTQVDKLRKWVRKCKLKKNLFNIKCSSTCKLRKPYTSCLFLVRFIILQLTQVSPIKMNFGFTSSFFHLFPLNNTASLLMLDGVH